MKIVRFLLIPPAIAFAASLAVAAPPQAFVPFLEKHCHDCHDEDSKKGGLDLTGLDGDLENPATLAKWVRVHDRVRDGEMPPPKKSVLPEPVRTAFLTPLATGLTQGHASVKGTVLRRLNRLEYERTVNDLLGTRVEVADLLPEDGKAHGFDNIGEALDLSPTQIQRYLEAAGIALDASLAPGPAPELRKETLTFDTGRNAEHIGKHWRKRADGAVVFHTSGTFPAIKVQEFRAPAAGRYQFRVHAAAHLSERPVTYGVYLGADTFEKSARLLDFFEAAPGPVQATEFLAHLQRGDTLRLKPVLDNPFDSLKKDPDGTVFHGLAVLRIEVEGPFHEEWPPRGHRIRFGGLAFEDVGPMNQRDKPWYRPRYQIQSADPAADIDRVLPAFIETAFRRPVGPEVMAPFLDLAQAELAAGADLEQALRTVHLAVLCAPDFLYLLEPPGPLDDHALAARLSYLFWGLPPDARLLELARRQELARPATLRAETERLLADQRSQWFTEAFAGQWLNLREIDFTTPDQQLYPEYDESLKHAMVRETEAFFDEVLRHNRSLLEFLDSDWTYLNERLAAHYRIEGVSGSSLRKVALQPEHHRGGVLAHASVLKVSANGTTTSPVVRGAYVLERILGIQPPPPPPGVPGVEPDIRGATTLRQLLDRHRASESCQSCHRVIDPPGFALESYDVMGGWREHYRSLGKDFPAPPRETTGGKGVSWRIGPPVDSSGTTVSGKSFADLGDYKRILLADPHAFTVALTEKLATYATGRGMGFSDRPELDRIARAAAAKHHGFQDLVHEVVRSEIFRTK